MSTFKTWMQIAIWVQTLHRTANSTLMSSWIDASDLHWLGTVLFTLLMRGHARKSCIIDNVGWICLLKLAVCSIAHLSCLDWLHLLKTVLITAQLILSRIPHFLQISFCLLSLPHTAELVVLIASNYFSLGCLWVRCFLTNQIALYETTRCLKCVLDNSCMPHLLDKTSLLLLLLMFFNSLQITPVSLSASVFCFRLFLGFFHFFDWFWFGWLLFSFYLERWTLPDNWSGFNRTLVSFFLWRWRLGLLSLFFFISFIFHHFL